MTSFVQLLAVQPHPAPLLFALGLPSSCSAHTRVVHRRATANRLPQPPVFWHHPLVHPSPCPAGTCSSSLFLQLLARSSRLHFPTQNPDDQASPPVRRLHDDGHRRRVDGHIGNCTQSGGEADGDGEGAPRETSGTGLWSHGGSWILTRSQCTHLRALQTKILHMTGICSWKTHGNAALRCVGHHCATADENAKFFMATRRTLPATLRGADTWHG